MRSNHLIFALCAVVASACASAPGNVWEDRESTDEGIDDSDDEPAKDAGRGKDAAKRDAGKASSGSSSSGNSSTSSGANPSGSASNDAGKSASSSSVSISITQGDASVSSPLEAVTDLLGGLGGTSSGASTSGDGGTKPSAATADGGGEHCAERICFDVFDCALWHGDALDCGFTKCEGFLCAK